MKASSGEEIVMGSVVSKAQRESPRRQPTQRRRVGAVLVEGQYAEETTPSALSLLQTSNKRRRLESEGHDSSTGGSQSIGTACSDTTSNGATAGSSSEGMDALDDDNDDIFLQLDSGDGGSDGRAQTQGDLETSVQQSHDSRTSSDKNILNETITYCEDCDCVPPLRAPDHALVHDLDRFTVTQFLHRGKEAGNNINVVYEIRCSKKGTVSKLILRDLWVHMPILDIGTVINVCHSSQDENGDYVIERDFGFVIVDPDKLISVTNVVGMSWCERKIAFSEHFRFPVDNVDTLRGTIAHDLICQVMHKKRFDPQEILDEVDQLLRHPAILEKAYGLGLSSAELKSLGHGLVNYVESIKECMKPVDLKKGPRKMQISDVVDIEDCYWSPKYGLKGKVDCTVETIDNHGQKSIIPMEFKTGRPNTRNTDVRSEHLGQVFLYSLMMGKTDMVGPNGLLHYIRDMHSVETSTKMNILQSLIMARNRIILNLASNAASPGFEGLPRPVNVDFNRHCNTCEYRNICALSLTEPTENEFPWSETETKLRGSLSHLSQPEMDFFTKWLKVIKLEADEDALSYSAKNLWIQSISKRESAGKCIGYLAIDQQIVVPASGATSVKFSVEKDRQKFLLNFAEKDFVVIGTLQDTCIGFSYIEDISKNTITVSFDRPILGRHAAKTTKFTIDKISSQSAGSMQYVYLSQMMEDNTKSKRLRRHLILKDLPNLSNLPVSEISHEFRHILVPFNKTQRVAMMQAVGTNSMLLVKGSPGCGKTTTIIGLIRLLVMQSKSVLVTAYTSNALDNILLAYKKFSNDFLRIGSSGKLNEVLLNENSTNYLSETVETLDQLRELYDSKPVVGTTLLSVKHPIFSTRKFDYCIVDEGSQALPTVIIGALLRADKWIVFGDPNQLPVTIRSRKIKAMKIEENVFSMLKEPQFSYNLNVQYRMNQVIMKVSNHLMYNNQMQCGSENQAIECLAFDKDDTMKYLTENYPWQRMRNWLCVAVSRKSQRSVMFFDTQCIGAFESPVASTLQNVKEKDIVLAIVRLFVECHIPAQDIGVIAPYRGQVHLIQENVNRIQYDGVEVNTVDQYQGREKRVIIVSFTKSVPHTASEPPSEDSILNDMRRLNVAITRAKAKIVLIGNSGCLKGYPACNKLLSLLQPIQKYAFSAADFYEGFFNDTV